MTDNPYQSPSEDSAAEDKGLPVSSYIGAGLSFGFVSAGVVLAYFGSFCVLGGFWQSLPPWMLPVSFVAMLLLSPVLGGLSAWESLRQSRRKMERRRKQDAAEAKNAI